MGLWSASPLPSWSAGFPNKVIIPRANDSSLNLLACLAGSSTSWYSVTTGGRGGPRNFKRLWIQGLTCHWNPEASSNTVGVDTRSEVINGVPGQVFFMVRNWVHETTHWLFLWLPNVNRYISSWQNPHFGFSSVNTKWEASKNSASPCLC